MSVDPTRRERLILFGVIPVVAAIVGAIVTVIVTKYAGGSPKPSDVMVEILKMQSTTPADKIKLMAAVNSSTDRFYTLLGSVVSIASLVCGVLVWAIADWIRKR